MATMTKNKKAVSLISGGLDSLLATKIIIDEGVDVTGLYFTTPFTRKSLETDTGSNVAVSIREQLGIEIRKVDIGLEYLEIVKNPKYGFGKGLNPCIDCKIFFLKRAWEIAKELDASFLVTGEVLGQRPMSQHRQALGIIDRKSGLEGKVLRPLSAQFLTQTEPELHPGRPF